MATVTGLTAERMDELIDDTIVNGSVVDSNLILEKHDGSLIDLGSVGGISKESSFPTIPAPEDGDMIIRTDLPGDPLFKFSDGVWEQQPRMGAQTVPQVRLVKTAGQAIANSSDTAVSWDSELNDTDSMHDNVTNNTRITIKTPGVYVFTASVGVSGAPTAMQIYFKVNGSVNYGFGISNTYLGSFSKALVLAAGDYVEVIANQNGGAQTISNSQDRTSMSAVWLGGAGQTVDERGVPAAKVARAASQSIPTSANTMITFDTERFDTEDAFVIGSPTRITIKTPGLYHLHGRLEFASSVAGTRRIIYLYRNGVLHTLSEATPIGGGDRTPLEVSDIVQLSAGDYIELACWHDAGAALLVSETGGNRVAILSAVLLATGKTVTPFAKAFNSSTFTVTSASTDYAVPLNTEEGDNDGIHDTATNNTRFVCRTAGVYAVEAAVDWPSNNVGSRQLAIKKNGSSWVVVSNVAPATGATTGQHVTAILELVVGDYLEMIVRSDGVAGLVLPANSQPHVYKQHMSMVKVGAPASGPGILGPANADVYTIATLPAANTFPNGRIVGVSDGAAGQQARMAMNGAWLNLG